MGNIIASIYEIQQEIGSGGGGVVYLGEHLRLHKQVVLKAYKRAKTSKPAALSREVDALKNLSHTYIPQVYDYVEEDGQVYSVMDYIEGESLDKPLKRGVRFSQPQVLEWACQLLEALCYLHSRPPHGILHSDIKPANIMLTPQGDIRLIDFNIALALGEEGAVRVGFSRGYASPEHYGVDYAAPPEEDAALRMDTAATQFASRLPTSPETRFSSGSGTSGGTVLLDVRSDIYSLGATVYHLLTGKRPPQDARAVPPISGEDVSPAVAAIVEKAMAPDPGGRYQSAAEMLEAVRGLFRNDPRVRRRKRRAAFAAALLAAVFLTGGASALTGLKLMERAQARERLDAETAEQALTQISASRDACKRGDVSAAVRLAAEALALDTPHNPQAQRALTDALGVYRLSDGFRPHRAIPLPGAPLKTALSPDGTYAAAMVKGELLLFGTERGEQVAALPAEESALSDVVFAGGDTVLYAGDGALRAYDVSAGQELWFGGAATGIALSADGSVAAAVYKDEHTAAVYRVSTGEVLRAVSFGEKHQPAAANDVFADPEDSLFALSKDGRWLAASFSDGSLRVFDLLDSQGDMTIFESSDYLRFAGGFSGRYLAFSAAGEAESVFAVVDMEAREQTGGFRSENPFLVQADESGICVATENILVALDPETGDQRELAYTDTAITAFVREETGWIAAALSDGSLAVYDGDAVLLEKREDSAVFLEMAGGCMLLADRDTPSLRVMEMQTHPEAQVFSYDRDYPHDEARISSGGNVMLYRYDRFRLYGGDGTLLAEEGIPEAGQVYDQQYRRDGREDYLEVFYNDGGICRYSAADGRVLSRLQGERPDGTLDEEFYTDHLRITAPLHGTPAAYDRETGALVRMLEEDAYLAYASQVGQYVVTEYVTAQGERWGLLLDGSCEILAELPGLCDITEDGMLVFDDMRGNLRQSRIYSPEELMALAEIYSKEESE